MWGKRVFNCLYTSAPNLVINLAVLPSLDAARRTHMPGMQKSLNVTYLGRVKRGKGMAGYINQPVISLWVTGHPLPSPLRLPCSPPPSPPPHSLDSGFGGVVVGERDAGRRQGGKQSMTAQLAALVPAAGGFPWTMHACGCTAWNVLHPGTGIG